MELLEDFEVELLVLENNKIHALNQYTITFRKFNVKFQYEIFKVEIMLMMFLFYHL